MLGSMFPFSFLVFMSIYSKYESRLVEWFSLLQLFLQTNLEIFFTWEL